MVDWFHFGLIKYILRLQNLVKWWYITSKYYIKLWFQLSGILFTFFFDFFRYTVDNLIIFFGLIYFVQLILLIFLKHFDTFKLFLLTFIFFNSFGANISFKFFLFQRINYAHFISDFLLVQTIKFFLHE